MEKHSFAVVAFLVAIIFSNISLAQSEPNESLPAREPTFTPSAFDDIATWLTGPGWASILTDPNDLAVQPEALFATYSFSGRGTTYNVEFYYQELYNRLRVKVFVGDRELRGLFNRFYNDVATGQIMLSAGARKDGDPQVQFNFGYLSLKESSLNTDAVYDAVEAFVSKSFPQTRNPWIQVDAPPGLLKRTCAVSSGGSYLVNDKGQIGRFTLENLLIAYCQEGIRAEQPGDFDRIGRSLVVTHGHSIGLINTVISDVNDVRRYSPRLLDSVNTAEITPPSYYREGNSQTDYWTCYACARYKMGPVILTRYKFGFQDGVLHSGERAVLGEDATGAYTGYPNLSDVRIQEAVTLSQSDEFSNDEPDTGPANARSLRSEKAVDTSPLLSLAVFRYVFVGAGVSLLALAYLVRRYAHAGSALPRFQNKNQPMKKNRCLGLILALMLLCLGCKKEPAEHASPQRNAHPRAAAQRQSAEGILSLHMATKLGNIEQVQALLAAGADINAREPDGYTPLHYAAISGHRAVAEFLIAHGADLNIGQGARCGTPLHCAVQNGHKDMVALLIDKGANINADNDTVMGTPVQLALRNDRRDIVRLLVAKGADVGARNIQHHQFTGTTTALHKAAKTGDIERVRVLISVGADVNAKERYGYTPLHYAAWAGRKDIVMLLIDHGADVKAATWLGDTPLHSACERHQKDIAELLISKGADVNARGNYGRTPLHHAARLGDKDLTALFLANGADVNSKEEIDYVPLHGAAQQGNTEVAKILISSGADVNSKNRGGYPPLQWAVENDHKAMVDGGLTGEVQHVCRQSCRVIRLFGFAWSLLLGTLSPDLWDFSL